MFMLRNVSKYLFGNSSKESIIDIPQGQLYLVRPLSPKGYSELLYRDAAASIRRTGQEFQYQLVVQRAYEEGEEELGNEDEEDDQGGADGLGSDRDEKTFLLDESLHFRNDIRPNGERVFAWRDLSGDLGDLFQFVCDPSVPDSTAGSFELVAIQCQFERKYRRSHNTATEQELQQFYFDEEDPIPQASPITTPFLSRSTELPSKPLTPFTSRSAEVQSTTSVPRAKFASAATTPVKRDTMAKPSTVKMKSPAKSPAKEEKPTVAPTAVAVPKAREILAEEACELHLFDFPSGTFVLQESVAKATVSEIAPWRYWLQITGKHKEWLGQPVVQDINPVFNFEYLSFIFNHYSEDGAAFSWLLRFKDQVTEERFQEGLMQALWEHNNQMKWTKVKDQERDYVIEAFQDLTMQDADEEQRGESDNEEEEDSEEERQHDRRSEHYDSDESEDDVVVRDEDGNVNSQLAVGYKHDRSFVVRGSKIGVFRHTPENNLELATNISKVQTPKGKLFSPTKVMLHAEDTNMVLQNQENPHSLYRMDLEYGKVVDEWKVHDDIPVNTFAPEKKFSQMTGEQTFLGLSDNALYRIDPRLPGDKLVDSELKQYVSKNQFSAAATTEKGYIAVASNKGDVRMFDRLGINAKTHIPALGDPIIGLDVSADGRWVLATTRTYLLLIDALQRDGKNEGKLGFEKAFAKDSKPQPRRLALTPSHVAQFQHETRTPISFTTAHFNTGVESSETTIVTSTGPFVVTWSMRKVLAGRKDPYSIKRYTQDIIADNFKFGTDKNLIVALPNEVNMVAKQQLRRPTRESIAMTTRAGARGSGVGGGGSYLTPRKSGLRREEVVNSPY